MGDGQGAYWRWALHLLAGGSATLLGEEIKLSNSLFPARVHFAVP